MTSLHRQIESLLVGIEQELERLGLWSDESPSTQALASQQPFCVDTLDFEQWLQFIFVPRMQALVAAQAELPMVSQVAPMAEVYFTHSLPMRSAAPIIALLREVDEALEMPR
jgi:uncharacterized protein YqcC (DUF446 family)